jgi:hypothetical protein
VPYLESLLTAYQTGLDDRPAVSLRAARAALAVATSADDRGRALAAVACALVRERVIPKSVLFVAEHRVGVDRHVKRTTRV